MYFDFHGGWMVRLGVGDVEMQEDERGVCCLVIVIFWMNFLSLLAWSGLKQ